MTIIITISLYHYTIIASTILKSLPAWPPGMIFLSSFNKMNSNSSYKQNEVKCTCAWLLSLTMVSSRFDCVVRASWLFSFESQDKNKLAIREYNYKERGTPWRLLLLYGTLIHICQCFISTSNNDQKKGNNFHPGSTSFSSTSNAWSDLASVRGNTVPELHIRRITQQWKEKRDLDK